MLKHLILLCFISLNVFSQKKKDIITYQIKTIKEINIKDGKTIFDNISTYNKNGKIIEEQKYDSLGKLKAVFKYKYNAYNHVIEQNLYSSDNTLVEKITTLYNKYGLKTSEQHFNIKNKIIKKHLYFYNTKGLKTERKTYDSLNVLVLTKKFSYQ